MIRLESQSGQRVKGKVGRESLMGMNYHILLEPDEISPVVSFCR